MRWLVTGANRGIGLGFAKILSEAGERVIATARVPTEASDLQALGVRVEALDVASNDSVANLAERLADEPIDVLINNAGMLVPDALGRLDFAAVQRTFNVNAVGPVRVLDALLPALRRGTAKKVVCITSQMGSIGDNGTGHYYGYRMSKAALNMAVKSAAIDLEAEGFTLVTMCPGWVQTDMGGHAASITVEQSVTALLSVIGSLTRADTGRFLNRNGETIPW